MDCIFKAVAGGEGGSWVLKNPPVKERFTKRSTIMYEKVHYNAHNGPLHCNVQKGPLLQSA